MNHFDLLVSTEIVEVTFHGFRYLPSFYVALLPYFFAFPLILQCLLVAVWYGILCQSLILLFIPRMRNPPTCFFQDFPLESLF